MSSDSNQAVPHWAESGGADLSTLEAHQDIFDIQEPGPDAPGASLWLECSMNRVSDGDRSTLLSFM